jgi:hypothetical protein
MPERRSQTKGCELNTCSPFIFVRGAGDFVILVIRYPQSQIPTSPESQYPTIYNAKDAKSAGEKAKIRSLRGFYRNLVNLLGGFVV